MFTWLQLNVKNRRSKQTAQSQQGSGEEKNRVEIAATFAQRCEREVLLKVQNTNRRRTGANKNNRREKSRQRERTYVSSRRG